MSNLPEKRKVFISFHQADRDEVQTFVRRWAEQEGGFIPKVLGASDKDDFVNSNDPAYVMTRIRDKYLGDSTVTIVLLGTCTHSRRYVDWELKTSLRQGTYTPNGVLGIILPSVGNRAHLPPRFQENWASGEAGCYARYRVAPSTATEIRSWIEDAHAARVTRAHLISNSTEMMKYNRQCKSCGVTH